jgi:hypothetical protein
MRGVRAIAGIAFALLAPADPVAAQYELVAPRSPGFLTNYDAWVEASALGEDDIQFQWDARIGAALDVYDYDAGRLSALAEYHGVFGSEFQSFDPNQSYYTFDASGSYRFGQSELAVRLHHVSRHLGDRPKLFGVDWNTIGVRVAQRLDHGRMELAARGSFDQVFKSSFVDYDSIVSGEARLRYPRDHRISLVAGGRGELFLTDEAIGGRSHVTGGIAHAGMRVEGAAAAVEFFVALERRVDPTPFTRGTEQWALVGFRVMNR